jgi:hypothetical protein
MIAGGRELEAVTPSNWSHARALQSADFDQFRARIYTFRTRLQLRLSGRQLSRLRILGWLPTGALGNVRLRTT